MLVGIRTSCIYVLLYTAQNAFTSVSLCEFYMKYMMFVEDYNKCSEKEDTLRSRKKII